VPEKPVILLTAPYMLPFRTRFTPVFDHFGLEILTPDVTERMDEVDILSLAGKFDGTICGDDHYSDRVLAACMPRLKVISKWGTGIDSIDVLNAQRRGIQVFRTTNAFTLPVADSVIGYILTFARKLPWMDKEMKSGVWKKIPGRSLSECTLGVIGVGNIGRAVLTRARGFDMTLLGNDIQTVDQEFIKSTGLEMTTLEDLLGRSDFISVNADLNPTSRHLINSHTLEKCKHGAVLINTARGPIVDESALIQSLKSGRLAGAALDVFEVEPLPVDSPLLKMNQVLLAPHNSNSSPTAWESVHWNTIRNLLIGLGIPYDDLELIKERMK
jgi:D-3-phosphoglycerate dehydrogenase / 2-oxoglutarate reductase